jgi:hypothetical protein
LEGGGQSLFLSLLPPHREVTADTLRRWLQGLLSRSGVPMAVFKPHSIRGASSSLAVQKGISIDMIMKTADWSSEHNFLKFYRRDVPVSFGHTILASK